VTRKPRASPVIAQAAPSSHLCRRSENREMARRQWAEIWAEGLISLARMGNAAICVAEQRR
jgi:hypothetical protein